MERFLGRFSPQIYAILRIVGGLLFVQHGAQKLFAVLGREEAVALISRAGLAGVIEFFGGLMIAVGLYTSWVAFVASGEMAFAYFIAHAPQGFFPITNNGELAMLYCFLFLYFASRGTVAWGIDTLRRRRAATYAPAT